MNDLTNSLLLINDWLHHTFQVGSKTGFLSTPGTGRDPDGFIKRSRDEDCIKCMLKIPHNTCESHRYIRVGGGYRHSYWYIRMLLEEIEFRRQQEKMKQKRLEAIAEGGVRAVKTYVRTQSGRLVERIIFLSDEDYQDFKLRVSDGNDPASILRKYMNKDEAKGLQSFEKEEQKAIKAYVRTSSGRLVEKMIYVTKEEYDAFKKGEINAHALLRTRLQLKEGETLEGAQVMKTRTITTKIRTSSGRIIEKIIEVSEDDYQKLMHGKNDIHQILGKYVALDKGHRLDGWEKKMKQAMTVVKTFVRTKSGKLVEKTILMTEDEYKDFLKTGGDPIFLKKYIKLKDGENIDKWEKVSTVYAASEDDEEIANAKPGNQHVDKDGNIYQVYVDPITGYKYKKKVGNIHNGPDGERGSKTADVYRTKDGKIITKRDVEKRKNVKMGKRNSDSASEFSYRSVVSAGGTRHVMRKKKNPDGTYEAAESYHSSQDEDGQLRRRKRRRNRKHGSDSAHSYYSVKSEGGTRHVRRRKKNPDGTYAVSESYHSADSEEFKTAEKFIKQIERKKKEKQHDVDSDHSYTSDFSTGGTRTRRRRQRIRDEHGNVIGYGKEEEYESSDDSAVGGNGNSKKGKTGKKGPGKPYNDDSDVYSLGSIYSAGGTRTKVRKKKIFNKHGKLIGYGAQEVYSSDSDKSFLTVSDGNGGKIKVQNPNSKKMKLEKLKAAKQAKKVKKQEGGFSDASTDSSIVLERLNNMTEEERQVYLAEREKRQVRREQQRKIKYGDKYEEILQKHKKNKERRKMSGFSDVSNATTDSDVVAEKLKNMTEEEKEAYLAEREKRKTDREQKRIEKFGDNYEDVMAKRRKNQKAAKSMVTYAKGAARFSDDKADNRGIGLAHGEWGAKGKGKGKDGNEADSESEEDTDYTGKKKGKKRDNAGNEEESLRNETTPDGTKRVSRKKTEEPDDANYFEVSADGKIKLKPGRKKIDINKLSKEDLLHLGIDPNLSKAEILRKIKEQFGEDVDVVNKGKKIGQKKFDEYSKVGTDELAEDSDLDIDTLKGIKRVKIILRRGGQILLDHMKQVMEQSKLVDSPQHQDERDAPVDYLAAYRLVDLAKLETYAKFFIVEDADDMDGVISYKAARLAFKSVPTVGHITRRQMDYVLKLVGIDDNTSVTFRMFSVVVALCERVTQMDQFCRELLQIANLIDMERKLALYRAMFYCNIPSDRDANYIKADCLRVELMAGGLNWQQQEFVMDKMQPNDYMEISFLDYLVYIPLFLSFHDNICDNPLDMSVTKYIHKHRASIQRDMNPLGFHLNKHTPFLLKNSAMNFGTHEKPDAKVKHESQNLINKYKKLPQILGSAYPVSAKKHKDSDSEESV